MVLSRAPAQVISSSSSLGNHQAAQARSRQFLAGRGVAGGGQAIAAQAAQALQRARALHVAATGVRSADVTNLSTRWTPLGPDSVTSSLYGPVTGRITSIALDTNDTTGNTVYLGTTGGGVWRSTDAAGPVGSVSFGPLTDTLSVFSANAGTGTLPSMSIGAVTVQPQANPIVLAGTGDPNDATDSYYGVGILRSADNGVSWTLAAESHDEANGNHAFAGLATAGFAWSTATPSLVVVAMSVSAEGSVVGAGTTGSAPGLYFSMDAGVTWQMATVMDGSQTVQAPSAIGSGQTGASATAVVWDPQRARFFAAVQLHGYYSSPDGQNWTRLANQPGTGLTHGNCPVVGGGSGALTCPILRGSLAVQPATGDLYALTVDVNDSDQGLWQDLCNAGGNGQCATAAPLFASRVDGGALEVGQGVNGTSTQIPQGSYNLTLAAAPGSSGSTILFAGTIDLYRCTLASGSTSCAFRNTTNAGNGCNAPAAVAPAQHAFAALPLTSGGPLLYIGNDGGLWRSTDGVAETGSVCAAGDATHFQNLNPGIAAGGSLAEIVGFAQDPSQTGTLIAGLGTNGSAATSTAVSLPAWPQLSAGEGGFPQIDPLAPNNWYAAIGAGVNLAACTAGTACAAGNFAGSAAVGAVQTAYDAALLDAPTLLDPQDPANLLTGTCRVWRGPAQGGAGWTTSSAISPAFDGAGTPCTTSSALIRALGAGGPASTSGSSGNMGSEVLYAGMAGAANGGGTLPGHLFVTKSAKTATSAKPWTDITGSPVQDSSQGFNAFGFDLSAVVVDTHDPTGATVYATVMGFGTGPHAYRSTDFGAHWTALGANLPDAPANALVVDPNDANTVYIALDTGVYVTQNVASCATQNCWSVLGSALPNAPVTQLEAGPALPTGDGNVGMLRAGTYGRGIWQIPLVTAHSQLQPQLSASPASLTFLSQPAETLSDALSVTLLSYGNAPAAVSTISVTGDFVETDTCAGQSLPPGSNCTVSVRFAPTATGGRSGLLTIYANVPGGQVTVALSGTGTAPATILLTPLQLSFSATLVNQTTRAQIVTISNTGGNTATLQQPTITGDFALGANTCGASLPSQTGCSLSITFTPKASGTRTGVLTLIDSAGTQTAQLSGTGESPATDTLTPLSLSFPQQQVGTAGAAQQVLLANAGDVALTLITAVVTSGDFIAVNQCGTSLAAHSSCAVNVDFAPSATGNHSGTLQVTDQFRTQTVSLAGSGLAPPGVSMSPSMADFGATGVGLTSAPTTFVLTNNGGVPLALASIAVTGDFHLVSSACGSSVAPGTACNIVLSFTPSTPGARSGTLTVADNAGSGKQTVNLTGTAVDFVLAPNGPTSITVSSGAIATFPLLLTSVSGLSGGVALSCTGAPANSVCTVNPSPAQLGGTAPVTVTVQTAVSTTGQIERLPGSTTSPVVLCFLLLPLSFRLRDRRTTRALARSLLPVFCFASVLMLGLAGCGSTRLIPLSGGAGGTGTSGSSQPTAPGSYQLQISGAAAGITHTVALSLVVQ